MLSRILAVCLLLFAAHSWAQIVQYSGATAPGALACTTNGSDGYAGAPVVSGGPQQPNILNTYSAHRPSWCVAGVDYAVGYPSNQTFTDWKTVSGSGWDFSSGYMRCNSGTPVLDGIDFTTTNASGLWFGTIYIPSGGCSSLTITNSKIGCTSAASGSAVPWFLHDQGGSTTIIFKNNVVDYSACDSPGDDQTTGNPSISILTSNGGSQTFQYNVLRHYCDHTIENLGNVSLLDFRFNLLDDPNNCVGSSAHMNYTQFGGGTASGVDVEYNTVYLYQSPTSGNEGFQFYMNGGAGNFVASPTFSHNTFVDPIGEICYAAYGTYGYGTPTTQNLTGTGTNDYNYFGLTTGLCGAGSTPAPYYPNSFTGWTNGNHNINMNNGAIVSNF